MELIKRRTVGSEGGRFCRGPLGRERGRNRSRAGDDHTGRSPLESSRTLRDDEVTDLPRLETWTHPTRISQLRRVRIDKGEFLGRLRITATSAGRIEFADGGGQRRLARSPDATFGAQHLTERRHEKSRGQKQDQNSSEVSVDHRDFERYGMLLPLIDMDRSPRWTTLIK